MKKLILYFALSTFIGHAIASDNPNKQNLVDAYKEAAKEYSLPDVEKTCEAIAQEKDNDMAKIYLAFLVIGGMSHIEKDLEYQKIIEHTRGW